MKCHILTKGDDSVQVQMGWRDRTVSMITVYARYLPRTRSKLEAVFYLSVRFMAFISLDNHDEIFPGVFMNVTNQNLLSDFIQERVTKFHLQIAKVRGVFLGLCSSKILLACNFVLTVRVTQKSAIHHP